MSRRTTTLAGLLALLVIITAATSLLFAQAQAKRLILKDGSYQPATQWEIKGERVRYFSAERSMWEEVPKSLVDWPATEKWNQEREAGALREARRLSEEEEQERREEEARAPHVAPGLRLPESGGVFLLDVFGGKQGMLNVPALSPLWLLGEYASKYNIQIETVMFQRFADARTALASGDLDITAFGPQDITLAVAQGAKSLVGVAGLGSGNDCLLVRKGEDITDWKALPGKRIGVGAGSISWLKFAASVQEAGVDYSKLRITNIVGGGANYLKALQGKEIDMAVVWQPFCAQAMTEGYGQYPTLDHNRSRTVGGYIAVLAVNRGFMEKNRDVVQRLVVAYLDVLEFAKANPQRWSKIYAEKAGLPEPVAAESIRITRLDSTLPLASIARMSKFLADNGVVTRDVSGEIAQHYSYEFLSKATGKSATELGQNQ